MNVALHRFHDAGSVLTEQKRISAFVSQTKEFSDNLQARVTYVILGNTGSTTPNLFYFPVACFQ